jgi:hypothetical protein
MTVRSYNTLVRMMEESAFQQKRATKAAEYAANLAKHISHAEGELADYVARANTQIAGWRADLAQAQEDAEKAAAEAEDLRALVERECAAREDWEVPEPPAEVPLNNTESFPTIGQQPQAVADMVRAVPTLSVMCANRLCDTDPAACGGCGHDCHRPLGEKNGAPELAEIQAALAEEDTTDEHS